MYDSMFQKTSTCFFLLFQHGNYFGHLQLVRTVLIINPLFNKIHLIQERDMNMIIVKYNINILQFVSSALLAFFAR